MVVVVEYVCMGRGCLCLVGRGHKLELRLVGCNV